MAYGPVPCRPLRLHALLEWQSCLRILRPLFSSRLSGPFALTLAPIGGEHDDFFRPLPDSEIRLRCVPPRDRRCKFSSLFPPVHACVFSYLVRENETMIPPPRYCQPSPRTSSVPLSPIYSTIASSPLRQLHAGCCRRFSCIQQGAVIFRPPVEIFGSIDLFPKGLRFPCS